MDAEGSERERALEQRIARLEARLDRLEGALEPTVGRPAAPVSTPYATPTPAAGSRGAAVRGPGPKQPPAVSPPQAPMAWRPPEPGINVRSPFSVGLPRLPSLSDIEARLTGQTLAWVGGLALVLAAIFFLSLAFSRGWIGPEGRVLIGLVAGAILLGGGAAFMERRNRLLGHVLTPVGLAVISISLVGATRLYGLIPVEVGLGVALLGAIAAAVIAVRADSQTVAAFGLVSVLLAPPLMGASPDLSTLAFVAIVLVGTTGVALWRSWSWLPPTAFVLAAAQAASWVAGDPEPAVGLLGVGLFWLLNVVAAGGEAFRRRRDDVSASSATLLLANVAFVIWAGFVLLSGELEVYRGFFLVYLALAQLGVGGFFVLRDGERNLFGLLAMGTGIAALTMAAPIQLGAPAVPVAWSAEAVALAWIAVRRGHPYSAAVSGILYLLAGLATVNLYGAPIESTTGVPFVDAPGGSLGFFIAAIALGVWIVRDRTLRTALAAFGLVAAAICVPAVLDAPGTTIALSILMVTGAGVWRIALALPGDPIAWQVEGLLPRTLQRIGDWRSPADQALPITTAFLGIAATWWIVVPVYALGAGTAGAKVPFVDPAGGALAVYIVALGAVGWMTANLRMREGLAAVGLLVTAWAAAAEFEGVALVGAWSALMVVGFALERGLATLGPQASVKTPPIGTRWILDHLLPLTAGLIGIAAAFHVIRVELPIARFGDVLPPVVPFTDDGAVAAAILIVAVLLSGAVVGGALARRVSFLVAGGVVAYAIPYEVYAWAVAVLWVGLGGLALVMSRIDREGRVAFLIADGALIVGAASVAVAIVARPARLVVAPSGIEPIVALQSAAALGAVAVGLAAVARANRTEAWARWTNLAAGVTVVYLLSVAVVDAIAMQVGGAVSVEELRTQAQVALSVLWAVLGVGTFVAGIRLRIDDLRRGGLALLALATAKVFLFDLAALDVAYRVISLFVLGLLLLASAWLWQRLQPKPPPAGTPVTEGSEATDPARS
jgi:uncharacterized membrane protein